MTAKEINATKDNGEKCDILEKKSDSGSDSGSGIKKIPEIIRICKVFYYH
jgi:hypothetical protein